MIFKPHSAKQESVIFSDKRIVIAATGIQWGKTKSGALWMKMMMHTFTNPDDNFIITSPTYPIFKQSTLPPFLAFMENLGKYDKKNQCFVMNKGGTCWFRTGKNPDSIVGITNVRAILCDEAGLYTLYFWENILGRSSFCKAPIRIVTSPYSLNWLYRDYIKPIRRDPSCLPNVELIQACSKDNPHFPADEYDEKKRQMDPRRFNMMYGGEFDKMQGLVYDCFDEDLNTSEWFTFPPETKYYGGIDWGFTEPFVLVVHALLPNGHRYQVSETYKSGLTLTDIGEICLQKKKIFNIERFYAGPDQPGSIEYLNRIGCPTVGANNDIRVGVDTFYEMIKARTYKIIKGTSPHTQDEMDTYHYPEPKDLKPDQHGKEAKPVGQDDHACLVGSTLVLTKSGHKKIEEVIVGEYVLTPAGFKKVLDVWQTGEKETIKLTAGDGRSIEATCDHPFYVPFKGFIPLDAINYSDILPKWEVNLLFLISKNIIGTVITIAQLAGVLKAAKDCMLLYGKHHLDKFLKATIYTIKTITEKITALTIWYYSGNQSILAYTHGNSVLTKSAKISTESGHSLQRGIEVKKGVNGIKNMLKTLSGRGLKSKRHVISVKKPLKRRYITPDFARIIVRRLLDVLMVWMIFKKNALYALKSLLRINSSQKKHARSHVLIKQSEKQSVYNLTVEDIGCFYANGFLVSNCDANRYVIVMTHRSNVKLVPKSPIYGKRAVTEEQRVKELMKQRKSL